MMGRIWRVHQADLAAEPGAQLLLAPAEAHHVQRVLRLKVGERIRLFDGRGAEFDAIIAKSSAAGVEVRLLRKAEVSSEAPLEVEIFQGLCRSDRLDLIVQKGTEMGVSAIHALDCERGERRGLNPRRLQRWRRITIEAAKQSGRSILPRLAHAQKLPQPPGGEVLALLLTSGAGAVPLAEIAASCRPGIVWLAIGPESGFSQRETAIWAAEGWLRASLGPRILRSETAALVAASIILHIWGDLGSASS
jgi:16S rRNA (uracil1498-N3)-methyltransferase